MRYRSSRDAWLGWVLWGSVFIPLGAMVREKLLGHAALMLAFAVFIAWIWFGTDYMITATHLIASCGPFRSRVPLDAITSVTRNRHPIAGPALSMNRLMVKYGKGGYLMVSPESQGEFLSHLGNLCPGANIDDPTR